MARRDKVGPAHRTRHPAVAGMFYPATPSILEADVRGFLRDARARSSGAPDRPPKALIVPHAGYVSSGSVAATACCGSGAGGGSAATGSATTGAGSALGSTATVGGGATTGWATKWAIGPLL